MNKITLNSLNTTLRLDKLLVELLTSYDYSRSYIQKLIKEECISVNDQIITNNNFLVKPNSEIVINIKDPILDPNLVKNKDIDLDIIYQDDDLLVINKQNNITVHPSLNNTNNTIVNALLASDVELSSINGELRPGIVHRIDKQTTGLLIVAKNDKTHKLLSEMFKNHQIYKEYLAIVTGVIKPNKGLIDAPIGRSQTDRKKMSVTAKNSKQAITTFEVVERFFKNTLVKCQIQTGRTHQIRVHFNYINHPVLNDLVYGKKHQEFTDFGQYLHAYKLKFTHPITKKEIELISPLPKEFDDKIKELRGENND
ncbi:RluA family pseudouridine synthase [Mycoplasma capricolum subsp. capripneumoniae]|uniref:Pseudouridine synthase n=1 Tax=Mycoplasma capricolum subsp. capripneumoniae 87001 TaxID=1124992 RepID=A0A9N7G7D8_MYCCC|nr:RluA family pseudouridine synthase [Mycoplasma capricolum]AJK51439.1 pseudouridine synthase [Mycoplasma capricolum subsp. capripneumoniae 87001]AOQ22117.1 RNA pseudouridine synthase [Mycoplasma capricolum subsp. capripneumoniae M1601]AQU77498.1 RNA pseudouridine synthase [Mycoplasma capricolum subsp. capripneumoniae]KEY84498.1 Ribosomal large subunit pseudouridylate synthase D [Mycoplasma capricolum subsp. capripneumoniae 99108]QDL19584.1 RluA family pseudouridine synthase [Mycoplasma capri